MLTTAQLAEAYGANVDAIKRNFSNNKAHYQSGKHFYLLEGTELKEFKNKVKVFPLVGLNANCLYLWTERGAFLHAKSLNADKTWEVYDNLVEFYFSSTAKLTQHSDIVRKNRKQKQFLLLWCRIQQKCR